jgi:multidrug efflux system outer membrane protein
MKKIGKLQNKGCDACVASLRGKDQNGGRGDSLFPRYPHRPEPILRGDYHKCIVAGGLLLLAGCVSLSPSLPSHGVAVPADFAQSVAGETTPPAADWWQGFGSGELAALIAAALQGSPDLAIAIRRIEQAEGQARVAGAPLFPLLNLNAGSSRAESRAAGAGRTTTGDASSMSLAASYEIDFWGKNASGARAALSTLAASRFDAETARLTLVSGVANAYFQVLSVRDRLRLARDNAAIAERVLGVVSSRVKFGNASGLDLNRQQTTVLTQRAAVPPLELQERQALAALAILLGRAPEGFDVVATSITALGVPVAAPGLPAALLLRRPDLASAEAQLVAANANIGAARAALLPSIQLTGSLGLASSELLSLASPTRSLSLGASLLEPIFNAGRLQAQVDIASARQGELVETYRRAILAALADVENSLAAAGRTAEQEVFQQQVRAGAKRSLDLAELRYKAGSDDLLTVLDAQRTLFAAQDQEAQVLLSRLQASVALYKALGGGWRNPAVSAGAGP